MTERLRKMICFGIFRRTARGEKPPVEVVYLLTAFGRRFLGIINEVRRLQEAREEAALDAEQVTL